MLKPSVLITGASGFLGKYIFDRFDNDEWDITSLGRHAIESRHAHINCDLAEQIPELPNVRFDKVILAAGKAHLFPKTQLERERFYNVNVKGTQHLLSALDKLSVNPKMIIFISSVAVYGKDTGKLIKEEDTLNSDTPYGMSKIQAEELVKSWAISKGIDYLLLRLPLIAGKNPPGNFGIMKNAIFKGHYLRMQGNFAQKSIVVASDVAKLIYNVKQKSGTYNLTDGIHPTFHDIEMAIQKRLGRKIKISIPYPLVKVMAKIGDIITFLVRKEMILTSNVLTKLNSDLTFDDSKARKELNWTSTSAIEFVEKYL
jgi:GlcNAc-P-P-Und epimerase